MNVSSQCDDYERRSQWNSFPFASRRAYNYVRKMWDSFEGVSDRGTRARVILHSLCQLYRNTNDALQSPFRPPSKRKIDLATTFPPSLFFLCTFIELAWTKLARAYIHIYNKSRRYVRISLSSSLFPLCLSLCLFTLLHVPAPLPSLSPTPLLLPLLLPRYLLTIHLQP
jgi:hypothetical protein